MSSIAGSTFDYEQLVPRFRDFLRRNVPSGAVVLVASKGDPRLTDIDGREGWHFPRTAEGAFAGAYPADGAEAVDQLTLLRAQGARYIAFPATAAWWLDHYVELREHLDEEHAMRAREPELGSIYALAPPARSEPPPAPPPGLVPLRSIARGDEQRERVPAPLRRPLRDVGSFFSDTRTATGGGRPIRICLVDTILQTGGAEWAATQLALAANRGVFEFMAVTFNSADSQLAQRLRDADVRVIDATTWSPAGLTFSEWKADGLFALLDRLSPDILFFSSQYLFEQLPKDRLAPFPSVVRISNFHEELRELDFGAASRIVCATEEQLAAVAPHFADRARLISTGVDLDLFRPVPPEMRARLRREWGLTGKLVVLFVARLSDPLKRTSVFEEVVRRVAEQRDDVQFLVVGYFERHAKASRADFERFVAGAPVTWREHVAPWEIPEAYQVADVLLSTSAEHEGLSNTVLQALASETVPVVTASAGMSEAIEPGRTGFIVDGWDAHAIAEQLLGVLAEEGAAREDVANRGRAAVARRFDFKRSSHEYQRMFLEVFREAPARVAITDGYFAAGGAEWLAAQLILTSNPQELEFELVLHRADGPLAQWLADRGVPISTAPGGTSYSGWMDQAMEDALRLRRPHVVMPCTITTCPGHRPFYRLLIISQNASDAAVLQQDHYVRADYILCVSDDVLQQLDPAYHWKMTVLHNSLDVEMFRPDPGARQAVRGRLGIDERATVILWCGRMHEPRKRLDVLMDLIEESARTGLDAHFLVVGYFRDAEGDQGRWDRVLTEHPNVSWVRGVAPWETPEYYSAADLYLSTSGFRRSDFEGLSLATVQALATGLPVVTTLSGGQREIVEDGVNGWLVEPGDVPSLLSALARAVDEEPQTLRSISAQNREKARARFDIRHHARFYSRLARLLKNTVGTAVTVDPTLPAPLVEFGDTADADPDELRSAASFLTYTYPLLASAPAADASTPETVLEGAEITTTALDAQAAGCASGDRLRLAGLGVPGVSQAPAPLARPVCALVRHLDVNFPCWSTCLRDGSDLVLVKS